MTDHVEIWITWTHGKEAPALLMPDPSGGDQPIVVTDDGAVHGPIAEIRAISPRGHLDLAELPLFQAAHRAGYHVAGVLLPVDPWTGVSGETRE
jgi:hypothetical protein